MIPFVPMIPGTVQDSASGVLTPVLLVGNDHAAKVTTVLFVDTGVIETVSEWLVSADTAWIKHYLETIA